MTLPSCYVCEQRDCEVIYRSQTDRSLTSLCQIHPGATSVYFCSHCGHCQSDVMEDVEAYYDSEYDILVDSEEEDQIYEVMAGKPIYRTEHQVRTLAGKIPLDRPTRLLDYGCAKSSTIRTLVAQSPNVVPYLFDVSARYIPFWERFAAPDNWSVNTPKSEWAGRFDVVTSFFSLEHIPTPGRTMQEIARLLAPGGHFYGIVPNVATNVADLIVVDHCNHFTESSLRQLITRAGLEMVELDSDAHRGAYVVVATKPMSGARTGSKAAPTIESERTGLVSIADFWRTAAGRVRDYEASLDSEACAIYGAGFYGAFIAASLCTPTLISCHIDQNPFLQGKMFNGKPVVSPTAVPADVRAILVGLNPAHARRVIAETSSLHKREFDYFFL